MVAARAASAAAMARSAGRASRSVSTIAEDNDSFNRGVARAIEEAALRRRERETARTEVNWRSVVQALFHVAAAKDAALPPQAPPYNRGHNP